MLVIGIHPPLQITESVFQFTDLTFNLVGSRGRRDWFGFITIYFPVDLPNSGLFSWNQIFVILIIEILDNIMS